MDEEDWASGRITETLTSFNSFLCPLDLRLGVGTLLEWIYLAMCFTSWIAMSKLSWRGLFYIPHHMEVLDIVGPGILCILSHSHEATSFSSVSMLSHCKSLGFHLLICHGGVHLYFIRYEIERVNKTLFRAVYNHDNCLLNQAYAHDSGNISKVIEMSWSVAKWCTKPWLIYLQADIYLALSPMVTSK
jgi:hypothetical protein